MGNSTTALMVNNIFYSIILLILLTSIVGITYRSVKEYIKSTGSIVMPYGFKVTLFVFGILFNIVAFFCIFIVFIKAISSIFSLQFDETNPIFFACNLVFLQNLFFMLVLFTRICCITNGTNLQLSFRIISAFIISFIISITIFIILLVTNIHIFGTDSWINCAVTLCVFNGIFMIAMMSLFLSKLFVLLRDTSRTNSPKVNLQQQQPNLLLPEIITKTSILSVISMSITFTSCLLLLFRYSKFAENLYVNILSDWLISINIYSNFACYSLSLKHYKKYYIKLCKPLDSKCKNVWYPSIFGLPIYQNQLQELQNKDRVDTEEKTTNTVTPTKS
eukprot:446230_1